VVAVEKVEANEKEGGVTMKIKNLTVAALFSIATLGTIPATGEAQDGILFRERAGSSNYCHLKFPAIREDTLASSRPVLSGEIIDFYGPCDFSPTGKAAVQAQRIEKQRRWIRDYAD
jgi:hypothetical protein